MLWDPKNIEATLKIDARKHSAVCTKQGTILSTNIKKQDVGCEHKNDVPTARFKSLDSFQCQYSMVPFKLTLMFIQ